MAVPKKLKTQKVVGILALLIVTLLPGGLTAQDDGTQPEKLLVGAIDLPPFVMKTADGRWEGLGIDLWRAVADELDVDFELREYGTIEQLKEAFLKDEIDVTPVAAVTPDREIYLDFSNHYYRSGVAIVVRAERAGYGWLRFVDRIFSFQNIRSLLREHGHAARQPAPRTAQQGLTQGNGKRRMGKVKKAVSRFRRLVLDRHLPTVNELTKKTTSGGNRRMSFFLIETG